MLEWELLMKDIMEDIGRATHKKEKREAESAVKAAMFLTHERDLGKTSGASDINAMMSPTSSASSTSSGSSRPPRPAGGGSASSQFGIDASAFAFLQTPASETAANVLLTEAKASELVLNGAHAREMETRRMKMEEDKQAAQIKRDEDLQAERLANQAQQTALFNLMQTMIGKNT